MELIIRFFLLVMKFLSKLFSPIFKFINRKKLPDLPPLEDSILFLSAMNIAKKIRNREISSETVVQAYINRIKAVNPQLNAVIDDRFEAALNDARGCDKKLQSRQVDLSQLELEKPLFGVPFTVKEACALKGHSYTGCTLVRRDERAPEDGCAVALLKSTGGIPLCVTNTPEICASLETSNVMFGTTNNPYDIRRISGGSSGGEGALIGAGASLIGVGSDIAGSIRVPSLYNGIFGHKPSPGIIPIEGHFPLPSSPVLQKYLTVGPMTRFCEDLILAMKIMSKKSKDNLRLDEPVNLEELNVFYMEQIPQSLVHHSVSDDIKNSIKKAIKYLKNRVAVTEPLYLEELEDVFEICISLFFCTRDMPSLLIDPDNPKLEKSPWIELIKSIFGLSMYSKNTILVKLLIKICGLFLNESQLLHYQKKGGMMQQNLEKLLGSNGVLLIPTLPDSAPFRNEIFLKTSGGLYCLLFNIFGLPATHIPMGFDKEGLPIGFQVVAGRNQDRLCLVVAKELENGFGGWVPPNKR